MSVHYMNRVIYDCFTVIICICTNIENCVTKSPFILKRKKKNRVHAKSGNTVVILAVYRDLTAVDGLCRHQGLVVQNIVSLTKSLRRQLVSCICRLHYKMHCYFCWKKVRIFCNFAHIFPTKNNRVFVIFKFEK